MVMSPASGSSASVMSRATWRIRLPVGHYAVVRAMGFAPANIVSPFGYVQLLGMGSMGVYMDDCVSGTEVTGKVFYQVHWAMFIGGGRDQSLFAGCDLDACACEQTLELAVARLLAEVRAEHRGPSRPQRELPGHPGVVELAHGAVHVDPDGAARLIYYAITTNAKGKPLGTTQGFTRARWAFSIDGIEASGVRAAWIKISVGDDGISASEAKVCRAAASATPWCWPTARA